MAKLTVKDLDIKNKVVLMRVDFNVPLDDSLNITDDIRIKAAIPTIKYILENGAKKIILMSHLGRPGGKVVENLRLNPVAKRLEELLGMKVRKFDDCVGEAIKEGIKNSEEKVILLENLRFHPEEEKNDPLFAKQLAELGDVFVNDAFGTCHRAHASTEGITHYLKSAAGFLLEKEIKYLGDALSSPKKPFVIILGGAKVSDKIGVIDNLLPKADAILVGGAMAYTFLKAKNINIGNSKFEKDKIEIAEKILEKVKTLNKNLVLPVDHVIADRIDENAKVMNTEDVNISEGWLGVDIGTKTIEEFKKVLKDAQTIVWNGPMGIFEIEPFSRGTKEIAVYIANLSAVTIVGGGDTASAVAKFGVENKLTHVSTGGGASLEYMEGKVLPGIAALSEK
ncbi:MAG: phosphoglycerate kinase [Candidatus Omnitrophota bacterium]